jgi:hypothetical protein
MLLRSSSAPASVDQRPRLGQAYSFAAGRRALVWLVGVVPVVLTRPSHESEVRPVQAHRVDVSYRWSMSWFIFSEVMFFAAFFGALYWARAHSVPGTGQLGPMQLLWPDFKAAWPSVVAAVPRPRPRAWWIPLPDRGPVLAAHHQYGAAAEPRA